MEIIERTRRSQTWFDYQTIWRWHFYAGLFCAPFVVWLSVTGSIYLFKPQIEAWIDRDYDNLSVTQATSPAAQVNAALAAVPGSNLHYYELPQTSQSAVRVIVGKDDAEFRVYIHPQTLDVLNMVKEDERMMEIVFLLHGELLLGDRGSLLVELAASWAIVMILTGIYLWYPRGKESRLAGVWYPRLNKGNRTFWRDIHAVTGVWVSFFALFLLLSGLPWAKNWGDYLKKVRQLTGTTNAQQNWTNSSSEENAERRSLDAQIATANSHEGHHDGMSDATTGVENSSYAAIDNAVATVTPLQLAYPVLISPPKKTGGPWTAKSDAQNRTLRVNLEIDPQTQSVLGRQNFNQRHWIDQVVGVGIATHEGQLFGWLNQLIGLLTAAGLILLSFSAVTLWWKRRPNGVLGAPLSPKESRFSLLLLLLIFLLGISLPLMGISVVIVALTERFVLQRIPTARSWLGLR